VPAGLSWLARAATDAVRRQVRRTTSDVMELAGRQVPVSLVASPAGEGRAIVSFRDESDRAELRDAVAAAFDQAASARRLLYDSLDRIDLPLTVYEVEHDQGTASFVVRFANRAAVGGSVTQVVGRPVEDVHPDCRLTGLRDALDRVAATGTAVRFTLNAPDGRDPRMWDALAAPVGGDHVITVLVDMTERRRTEEELRRARDAAVDALSVKSRFLSTVTHELRTPLTTVIASSELLLDSALDLGQAQLVTQQREAAALLLSLINSTLDLAQLESGRATLERTLFDLEDVRRTVFAVAEPWVADKPVTLTWDMAPDVPRSVVGDPLRFTQAVTNLVTNAAKFTAEGGVGVDVSCGDRGPGRVELVVAVRDSGPGIDAEHLERIFEPFAQADASVRRTAGGSGLGLAITRDLVELMGGRIAVHSTLGTGTTFELRVPLGVVVGGTAPGGGSAVPGAPMSGRVLLVDDTAVNRTMLAAMLRKRGLEVVEAADGAEAVALASAVRPGLVLMDLRMPVLDGYDATRAIRAAEVPGSSRLPIVALTASVSAEVEAAAIEAGMDAVLSKPVDGRALDEVVRTFHLAGGRQGAEVPVRP
jgi:signal transduction histidine kinase/CheY-like chemotaxis protein